ncbi:phosphotransferase [Amycolatopsis thermoflava]|uniref:phosphotransferase n=1 Tax=Amycolatopsis thermoflava TaxID=84480 RepID=UPI003D74F465
MTVDTSPGTEDDQDPAVAAVPASGTQAVDAAVQAAETVLTRRFGSAIGLVEPEALPGSGPATVVRARIAASPFGLPRTLVIKHYPDAPPRGVADPFAQEAVSYQLFTALPAEDRMCPELLAHDGPLRVIVIDDLGRAPTLWDKLRGQDARLAERALLSWARSLGRLHATTAGREADFEALLRRLGGFVPDEDTTPAVACARLPTLLAEAVGVTTPDEVRAYAENVCEASASSPYRAFSPVDLSPDNNLVTSGGVHFLDFERGLVRNALVDAAHLRVPFATCEDARALPSGMSEAMIAAWKAEVSGVWPALGDNEVLAAHLLDHQMLLVWVTTWADLGGAGAEVRPNRVAALVSWWKDLGTYAERGDRPEVAAHAREVAKALDARFGPGLELPLYPAFR